MSAQVLVAEEVDDLVPVGGVAQNSRADPPTTWSNKQSGVSGPVGRCDPAFDQLPNLFDDRHRARPAALGSLVDEAARPSGGLPPNRPGPVCPVDVSGTVAVSIHNVTVWPAR